MRTFNLNSLLATYFVAFFLLLATSCGGDTQKSSTETATPEKNKIEKTTGHEGHNHGHEGHNHGSHEGHNHGHEGHNHGSHKGHNHSKAPKAVVDKTGSEYTSTYICPMHCKGSGSNKVGKCSTCSMAYVKNKATK